MSNHSKLRDLRSEGVYLKNKYKLIILKIAIKPQIKEAFVGSQYKYKIYIKISIRVQFWCLLYMHNFFKKLSSLICAWFINFRFNTCVVGADIIGDRLVSVHSRRSFFVSWVKTTVHTNMCHEISNIFWPASWLGVQSSWLITMRFRVRFCTFSWKGKTPIVTMVWVVVRN